MSICRVEKNHRPCSFSCAASSFGTVGKSSPASRKSYRFFNIGHRCSSFGQDITPVTLGSRFGEWQGNWLGGWGSYRLYYLVIVVKLEPRRIAAVPKRRRAKSG